MWFQALSMYLGTIIIINVYPAYCVVKMTTLHFKFESYVNTKPARINAKNIINCIWMLFWIWIPTICLAQGVTNSTNTIAMVTPCKVDYPMQIQGCMCVYMYVCLCASISWLLRCLHVSLWTHSRGGYTYLYSRAHQGICRAKFLLFPVTRKAEPVRMLLVVPGGCALSNDYATGGLTHTVYCICDHLSTENQPSSHSKFCHFSAS